MLFDLPVIVAIFMSLGLILVLDKFIRNLSLSILAGTFFLAFLSERSLKEFISIPLEKITDKENLMLYFLVWLMIFLSNQIKENNIMGNMTQGLKSRFSGKTLIASVPIIMGLIPMPGGALFSAPLVEACDVSGSLDNDSKAKINYWFRHVWEFWFPLFAAVIMAMQITHLKMWQMALVNLPLSICTVIGGWYFILRKLDMPSAKPEKSDRKPPLFRYLSPIAIIIIGSFILSFLFPALNSFSKFMSLILSLIASITVCQLWKPLGAAVWKKMLLAKNGRNMVFIVAIITVYSGFISVPLEDGRLIIDIMKQELSSVGIPGIILFAVLPFISGLATGIALGFVGTSFPITYSLLGTSPDLKWVLIMVVLGYGFGLIGTLLSPVHVCNVVTHKYFNTNLFKNTLSLIKPCGFVAAGAVITAAAVYFMM